MPPATETLPDRVESDRIIFTARRDQYITYIGTKTPVGPDGSSSQISGFIQDPAVRFQIMWQGAMLNEMKVQKVKVEEQIKRLIKEIDEELGDQ